VVPVDMDGQAPEGMKPSSEWRFHRDIYAAFPGARAIVHAHSPFAVALACLRRDIPAFHYMVAMAGGADIRCARYATFGTQALSDAVVEALKGSPRLPDGQSRPGGLGGGLAGALALAVEVEALCGQYLRCLQAGEPVLLNEVEMAEVLEKFRDYRERGLMRWLLGLLPGPGGAVLPGHRFPARHPAPVRISMADLDRGKAIVDSLGLRRLREGEARQVALPRPTWIAGSTPSPPGWPGAAPDARIAPSRSRAEASLPLPSRGPLAQPAPGPGARRRGAGSRRLAHRRPEPAGFPGGRRPGTWALARSPFSVELAAARELLGSARLSGQTLVLGFTWRKAAMARRPGGQSDPGAGRTARRDPTGQD
jgi:L-fuculose-phosphate aldolase